MTAYYNEIDEYAAQWLRNLIKEGHIADGTVDTRSILDVAPADLRDFTQCHFFAGIGVWSHTLRLAGWPDDRPVWTGSCPCQPFSAAGKGGGFDDERHLWPHLHYLIEKCGPPVVLGEQVASKDGLAWLDLVQADLEGAGYAAGAVDLCAAGVGAPHIRQRLWWVARRMADTDSTGQHSYVRREQDHSVENLRGGTSSGLECSLAGRNEGQSRRVAGALQSEFDGLEHAESNGWFEGRAEPSWRGVAGGRSDSGVAHADSAGRRQVGRNSVGDRETGEGRTRDRAGDASPDDLAVRMEHGVRAGPTNGHWRDADWLFCRDGKWRPVEPGTFPLAHGAAARVGKLRAYGNAISPWPAAEVISAFMECRP